MIIENNYNSILLKLINEAPDVEILGQIDFASDGQYGLSLIGQTDGRLITSLYSQHFSEETHIEHPLLPTETIDASAHLITQLLNDQTITAAIPIKAGGIATTLAKLAVKVNSCIYADIEGWMDFTIIDGRTTLTQFLWGENLNRFFIVTSNQQEDSLGSSGLHDIATTAGLACSIWPSHGEITNLPPPKEYNQAEFCLWHDFENKGINLPLKSLQLALI